MNCPICHHSDTRVVDSRSSAGGGAVRRRRECAKCEFRFSTIEEIEIIGLTVVKRDGRREAYSREKLERGLRKALEKRSYTALAFRGLVQAIELEIQRSSPQETRSADVGEIIMKHLKAFDKIAYIRFASVYRSFEDVETFERELARLRQRRKKPVSSGKEQGDLLKKREEGKR